MRSIIVHDYYFYNSVNEINCKAISEMNYGYMADRFALVAERLIMAAR